MAVPGSDLHLVAAADDRYARHLGAALISAIVHLPPEIRVHCHVIDGGLGAESRDLLERTVVARRATLQWIGLERHLLRGAKAGGHLSAATYCKVLVPELLGPLPEEKALYLDCDVIVTGDLSPLWRADITGFALAAVADIGGEARKRALSIPGHLPYFNAGVLLFNLKKWREEGLSDKVMAYAAKHRDRLVFHDQDALNAVLHRDWLELPAEWNVQTNMLARSYRGTRPSRPMLIHYTGTSKPWHYDNVHPYKREYDAYSRLTAWQPHRPKITITAVAKKAIKRLLPGAALEWVLKEKDKWAQGSK